MPMLTILPAGKTVEVAAGSNLLDAIRNAGVEFVKTCSAPPECGACHVFIHEGRKSISKIQRTENEKLDTLVGVGSKSRLACQVTLGAENVTAELLDFKSGL